MIEMELKAWAIARTPKRRYRPWRDSRGKSCEKSSQTTALQCLPLWLLVASASSFVCPLQMNCFAIMPNRCLILEIMWLRVQKSPKPDPTDRSDLEAFPFAHPTSIAPLIHLRDSLLTCVANWTCDYIVVCYHICCSSIPGSWSCSYTVWKIL